MRTAMKIWFLVTVPVAILFIMSSRAIHPAYRVAKLRLGLRMFWNTQRIATGTSFKSHLVMALKLFEMSPDAGGIVVECGTWKGGSAANLSLACRITGRRLKVYDSFQGLPEPSQQDREAHAYTKGDYRGTLDEVRRNIERYGAIECCDFIPGWFEDTLPSLSEPVVLAFLDVDLERSLETCVRAIWPNLVDRGYVFTDESPSLDYCALFWSERWWDENFNRTPPGLIGSGSGLALGEFYFGPWDERDNHPTQHVTAPAYTRKDWSGHWPA